MENYETLIKEIMINQPIINIGMIGHVANGKSTITKDISGETTQRHSKEKIKNITIKLGYANAKIYKCNSCSKPECYQSNSSESLQHLCKICDRECDLITHVSFADCPGHNLLMSTMLNGTCIMNYNILVESATNDKIPELQTMEHFEIAHESNIPTALICLNKLDLMLKNKNKIPHIIDRLNDFVQNYKGNVKIPIVPVSGTQYTNIDVLCEYIANLQIPQKDISSDNFKMLVIRSFNVNKEKTVINDLKGGVIGGSIVKGIVKINDDIVVYPGFTKKNKNGKTKWTYTPLQTKALSINSGKNKLECAIPGGLIGIQLDIDPSFTTDDELTGQVIYKKTNNNVKVYEEITLKYTKLSRKLTKYITDYDNKLNINDTIQININSNNIKSKIKNIDNDCIELILEKPITLENNEIVTISKLFDNERIDIVGRGFFVCGFECEIDT